MEAYESEWLHFLLLVYCERMQFFFVFVFLLCKLNFATRQSILASFLVYLVLAQDSGFWGPNSSDISITV